jgi:hypothetical protein
VGEAQTDDGQHEKRRGEFTASTDGLEMEANRMETLTAKKMKS